MTVRAAGLLARFAVESGRLTDSRVKPKLFEPNRALELSVFHVDGLVRDQIRDLGDEVVKKHPSARKLRGWGEFPESAVRKAGLRVERDDDPPRHANIVDWPQEPSERKQRQQILASHSYPVNL